MRILISPLNGMPEGPRRTFFEQLRLLHDNCGRPSTRRIAAGIMRNNSLPDTVSHETVASVLRGDLVPSWSKVECIVATLSKWSVTKYDLQVRLQQFHALWLEAVEDRETPAERTTGAAGAPAWAPPARREGATGTTGPELPSADRSAEIWACAYVRSAAYQLQELARMHDGGAVPPGVGGEAYREKILVNARFLTRFLLLKPPGEWTAWDFAPRWVPGPAEVVERLRYWYGATTRYGRRMSRDSSARHDPGSLEEFDVEVAAADCLALMAEFIATLTAVGSPYASFVDSRINVVW